MANGFEADEFKVGEMSKYSIAEEVLSVIKSANCSKKWLGWIIISQYV